MYNHPQTAAATLKEDVDAVLRGFLDAGMRVAFSSYLRNQNRVVYTGDDDFLGGLPADLADDVRRYLSVAHMSDDDYFAFCETMVASITTIRPARCACPVQPGQRPVELRRLPGALQGTGGSPPDRHPHAPGGKPLPEGLRHPHLGQDAG